MKIIRNYEYFLQFNLFGLTIDFPKEGAEERYKKDWFCGLLSIPFTSKILIFVFYKNFTFKFSIFNPIRKTKNEADKAK